MLLEAPLPLLIATAAALWLMLAAAVLIGFGGVRRAGWRRLVLTCLWIAAVGAGLTLGAGLGSRAGLAISAMALMLGVVVAAAHPVVRGLMVVAPPVSRSAAGRLPVRGVPPATRELRR